MKNEITTIPVGTTKTYGPYIDGRTVVDAIHTDGKKFWYQSGYPAGTTPRLKEEWSLENCLANTHRQGWGVWQHTLE